MLTKTHQREDSNDKNPSLELEAEETLFDGGKIETHL